MQGRPVEAAGSWDAKAFLAYASEDEDMALAMQNAIDDCPSSMGGGTISVTRWRVVAELSESILQSLQVHIEDHDFGIFIYTPVDMAAVRESEHLIARDNVVFETGLFMGKKGRRRTILLLPDKYLVTPSDLTGIIGIKYAFDKVKKAEDHSGRTGILGPVAAKIVEWIQGVMNESPANQEQPDTGLPPVGTSTAQPASPLEVLGVALVADAAQGNLKDLENEDIKRGRLVVHAIHGVGQVEGYDPPNRRPRYITVRFGSSTGVFDMSELFVARIRL